MPRPHHGPFLVPQGQPVPSLGCTTLLSVPHFPPSSDPAGPARAPLALFYNSREFLTPSPCHPISHSGAASACGHQALGLGNVPLRPLARDQPLRRDACLGLLCWCWAGHRVPRAPCCRVNSAVCASWGDRDCEKPPGQGITALPPRGACSGCGRGDPGSPGVMVSGSLLTSKPSAFPPAEAGRPTEPLLFLFQLLLPPPRHHPTPRPLGTRPPSTRPPSTPVSLALYQCSHRQLPSGKLCDRHHLSPTTKAPAPHHEYQLLPAAATSLHEASLVQLEPCNPPGSSHLPSGFRPPAFAFRGQRSILPASRCAWKIIPAALVALSQGPVRLAASAPHRRSPSDKRFLAAALTPFPSPKLRGAVCLSETKCRAGPRSAL